MAFTVLTTLTARCMCVSSGNCLILNRIHIQTQNNILCSFLARQTERIHYTVLLRILVSNFIFRFLFPSFFTYNVYSKQENEQQTCIYILLYYPFFFSFKFGVHVLLEVFFYFYYSLICKEF